MTSPYVPILFGEKMKKISTIAVSLGLVVSVAAATPARADAYFGNDFEVGNVEYRDFDYNPFAIADFRYSEAWMTANPQNDEDFGNAWDAVGFLTVDGTPFTTGENAFTTECDKVEDGVDVVITCPSETLSGLEIHPEMRFFDAEQMSRIVWVFENNSGADITVPVVVGFDSDCNGDGYMTTSGGNNGSDPTTWDMDASTWSVQRGVTNEFFENEKCAIEVAAWQGPQASVLASTTLEASAGEMLRHQDMAYDLTVKAGQTVGLAYFFGVVWVSDGNENADTENSVYTVNRAAAFTAAVSAAGTTFGSWSETLSKGLDADLFVANWESESQSALPNTGVDAGVVVFAATGAVAVALVGLGLMAARRRRAQA